MLCSDLHSHTHTHENTHIHVFTPKNETHANQLKNALARIEEKISVHSRLPPKSESESNGCGKKGTPSGHSCVPNRASDWKINTLGLAEIAEIFLWAIQIKIAIKIVQIAIRNASQPFETWRNMRFTPNDNVVVGTYTQIAKTMKVESWQQLHRTPAHCTSVWYIFPPKSSYACYRQCIATTSVRTWEATERTDGNTSNEVFPCSCSCSCSMPANGHVKRGSHTASANARTTSYRHQRQRTLHRFA